MKLELRDEHPDKLAAMAARGDYMSESLVGMSFEEAMEGTDKDHQEFLNDKAYRGHFGVFEHKPPAFFIEGLSRVAMAQLTRHRHLSFDVQSQRYVDFSDKNAIIPPSFSDTEREWVYYGDADRSRKMCFVDRLARHWEESVKHYEEAIEAGIPKEDARFFLPQATPVNMTMTGNNRAFMNVLDLRENAAAQWEAQEFAEKVHRELKEYAPKTFEAYEDKTNNNSLRSP